jgi:hypothetical protein
MNHWNYRIYKNNSDRCDFEEWLDELPVEDKANLQHRLEFLKTQRTWDRPYVGIRRGHPKRLTKIYEIVIKGVEKKVQLRPLGFYSPTHRGEFILLIGAVESNSHLEPRDADDTADRRCKRVLGDRERYSKPYE